MLNWIGEFSYLFEGLLLAGGALLAMPAAPKGSRYLAFWSGLLLVPFSCTGILFEPEYWSPQRAAAWAVGPEDLLFTFGGGAWAWLLSISAMHRPRLGALDPKGIAARYAAGVMGGLAVGIVCRLSGMGPMTAAVVAIALVGLFISRTTNRSWRQWAAGSVGFTVAHCTVLKVTYLLNPAFALQWNTATLWGPWIWGVPLDEIIWAAACGAVWPAFVDFVLGVIWTPDAVQPARSAMEDWAKP